MESRATIFDLAFDLSKRYPHATIFYGPGSVCEHHLNVSPVTLYRNPVFQKYVDELCEMFREAFPHSSISFNDDIVEIWTGDPQFTICAGKVSHYRVAVVQ